MNSNAITKTLILIIGLSLAIVMANMVITDKAASLMWFGAAAILITGVSLGRNIWILLPAAYGLGLTLMIPGRPSTVLLASLIFLSFASLMVFMRRLPWRGSLKEMDVWIILIAFSILQVYMRNPVGFNLLGGGSVGGRPYVLIGIGFATYFFLANYILTGHQLKQILKITVFAGLLNFFMSLVGFFIPSIGIWYGAADVNEGGSQSHETAEGVATTGIGTATRVGFLSVASNNISLFVSSFRSPLTAIFHPLWGLAILTSFAFAAMSGFRNAIISMGLTYVVGIAYRSGFAGLVISTFGLSLGLALLAIVNTVHPLPPNIQRSFSFLPGTWNQRVIEDAEGSTEWRVEIWKEVMLTERWIKNKYLGDGLGFSAHELNTQKELAYKIEMGQTAGMSFSGFDFHRESILANGDYHSGPIQTIRVVGYVGLLILLLTQWRLAVHAHRQIQRCRGTEFYPLSLFVGIPLIYSPIFFITVFGSFEQACGLIFLGSAYVKLMENNLPLEPYRKKSRFQFQLRHGQGIQNQPDPS